MPKLDVDRLANELVTGTKLFINKQMERFEARFAALEKRLEDIPVPKDGKDGLDGKDADPKEIAESIREQVSGEIKSLRDAVAEIPSAKDGEKGDVGASGKDGLDGKDADPKDVANILVNRKDFMVEVKGEKGDPGKRGARGEKGDRGEPGADGRDADNSAIAKMLMGAKDFRDMVMGEKGEKGDPGDRGEPGARGEKGESPEVSSIIAALKADPEFLDMVRGEKGEKGDPGKDGEKGDVGHNGERGEAGAKGEKGEKGDSGERGEKGDPGKDGSDIKSTIKDANGHLILTLSNGDTIDVGRVQGADGKDGEKGLDGKDGSDGINADMFHAEYDDERTVKLMATVGGSQKELGTFVLPIPIYRGVFSKDTSYVRGDSVTYGGSTWILTPDAEESQMAGVPVPGNSKSWTLSNKRGRDGKDGVMKPEKAITPIKTK